MIRRTTAFFVCMILSWIAPPSHSAEINWTHLIPTLNGEIYKGDYDKVVAVLRLGHAHLYDSLLLNSPGGDVYEALKIGRLLRKYLIATMVEEPNMRCASACALIWFGGIDRVGTVGLHRPRIDDPVFKGLAPTEASVMYRRVLDMIAAYLNEMEVPKSIIELMIATSSTDIQSVDAWDDKLARPASIAEWVDASCGKSPLSVRGLSERQYKAYLEKFMRCQTDLFDSHRARLPPP